MQTKRLNVFGRTLRLEREMDEFLDRVSEAGIIFKKGVASYLEGGISAEFEILIEKISDLESRGDEIRREVEYELYERTLIPDLRADVLSLLESIDILLNDYEENMYRFLEEIPDIPEQFAGDFIKLAEATVACVECCVLAARAFFRDLNAVGNYTHKVLFHESEADDLSSESIRRIFRSDLDLSHKCHLRYFLDEIDAVADRAEDIADDLTIFVVKRQI